jgi:hypothetical protein
MTIENKRINIQYSIDLSELSDEVQRLYDKAFAEFKEINFTEKVEDILNFSTAIRADEIRQKLAKLDLILSDIQSIVSSYVEYEASSINSQPQVENSPAPAGMPEMPNISDADLGEMSRLFNGGVGNELQKPDQRSK